MPDVFVSDVLVSIVSQETSKDNFSQNCKIVLIQVIFQTVLLMDE